MDKTTIFMENPILGNAGNRQDAGRHSQMAEAGVSPFFHGDFAGGVPWLHQTFKGLPRPA